MLRIFRNKNFILGPIVTKGILARGYLLGGSFLGSFSAGNLPYEALLQKNVLIKITFTNPCSIEAISSRAPL